MERIIDMPKRFSICFIGGSIEKSRAQIDGLKPLLDRYEIDFCLRGEVYSGMYSSFSQIVNELISDAKHEFIVFVSEKVDPTPEKVEELLGYLCSGFCWASKVAFGFFAATKELFRNIGLMDERFIGSEWEDIDLLCRMYMFGKAIRWEYDRSQYPAVPSKIGRLRGASLTAFLDKWIESDEMMIMDSEYLECKKLRDSNIRRDISGSWLPKSMSVFMDDNNNAHTIFKREISVRNFEKRSIVSNAEIDVEFFNGQAMVRFRCPVLTKVSMQILNSEDDLATWGILIESNKWYSNSMFQNAVGPLQIKIFHEGDKIFHDRSISMDSGLKIGIGLRITEKTLK